MSTATVMYPKASAEAVTLVEVCSVRLAQTWFGVPITHILEIVGSARPQPVPLAPAYVGGLVHYRGDVLTSDSLCACLRNSEAFASRRALGGSAVLPVAGDTVESALAAASGKTSAVANRREKIR